jgi:hypothetical protein
MVSFPVQDCTCTNCKFDILMTTDFPRIGMHSHIVEERNYHPILSPSLTVIRSLSGTVYFTILLVLESKSNIDILFKNCAMKQFE